MNTEIQIDLKRCLNSLIKKWWIVAIASLSCLIATFIFNSNVQENSYYAEATVYSVSGGSYQETLESNTILKTYADIITSLKVSERAALLLGDDSLNGETVQKMIKANYNSTSTIISIFAFSLEPDLAIRVANAVADAFVIEVKNITGNNTVQLLDKADSFKISYDGQKSQMKARILGFMAGLILSSIIIVLIEIFSTKVHSINDCSLNGELEIIGIIPSYDKI